MDDLLKRASKSLTWMVEEMKHRHDDCGVEGNYSPELLEAIEVLELIKKKG